MSQYCSPADVKNLFAGTDANLVNTQISALITLASAEVENICNRVLAQQTITNEQSKLQMDKNYQIVVRAQEWPITNVASLAYQIQGQATFTTLDVTWVNWQRDPERFFWYTGPLIAPPSLQLPYYSTLPSFGRNTPGIVQYTYTAGYATIPDDIVLATALLTQDLIMSDANPAGASAIQVTAEGSQDSISFAAGQSMNYKRAVRLLDRYIRRI